MRALANKSIDRYGLFDEETEAVNSGLETGEGVGEGDGDGLLLSPATGEGVCRGVAVAEGLGVARGIGSPTFLPSRDSTGFRRDRIVDSIGGAARVSTRGR